MDKNKFDAITNNIIKAIDNATNKDDLDELILSIIAMQLIIDVMPDEETMNDSLIELDRIKVLKKRR